MTLCTSANNLYLKNAWYLLLFSLFFALFGAVYEKFSHEVYSYYMLYAWAIPLVLGVLPFLLLAWKNQDVPKKSFFSVWDMGICTWTVGCALQGVLEIYGTTNWKMLFYWLAGGILLLMGLVMGVCQLVGKRR